MYELRRGSSVHCAFLTEGSYVRNEESRSVLTTIGVPATNIHFFGSGIPDGRLVYHLDRAFERLETIDAARIYCLAWEGGHHDHDASHLVAVAVAKKHGKLDYCRELPLYRAFFGPLFRVMAPIGRRRDWERRKMGRTEGLRIAFLAWRYRSQRRSWIGLFPEAFVKLVLLRRELTRRVDVARLRQPPHRGKLFYERRFDFPRQRFADASAAFIERHFPDHLERAGR